MDQFYCILILLAWVGLVFIVARIFYDNVPIEFRTKKKEDK